MTLEREDLQSWAVSIGAHCVLLLFALFWQAYPEIADIPQQIDVFFSSPAEEPTAPPPPEPTLRNEVRATERSVTPSTKTPHAARTAQPRAPEARKAPAPSTQRSAATAAPRTDARTAATSATKQQSSATSARTQSASGSDIPVPPTTLRSRESVTLSEPGTGKAEASTGSSRGFESRGGSRESTLPGATSAKKDAPGSGEVSARPRDGGPLSGTPTSSSNIDWGAGLARTRIAGALPAFPPGVTREAVIKVRFTVKPNGTVTALTLLQKGEPQFEQVAMAAMRGWKFNALPASVEHQDQQGIATFVFKLK